MFSVHVAEVVSRGPSFHVEMVRVWVRKFISGTSVFKAFCVYVTVFVMINSFFKPSASVVVLVLVLVWVTVVTLPVTCVVVVSVAYAEGAAAL